MDWIDMRLSHPPKMGDYLVTTKNNYVVVGKWLGKDTGWNGRLKNCVVAWAFLPEPYQNCCDCIHYPKNKQCAECYECVKQIRNHYERKEEENDSRID